MHQVYSYPAFSVSMEMSGLYPAPVTIMYCGLDGTVNVMDFLRLILQSCPAMEKVSGSEVQHKLFLTRYSL